MTRKQEFSKLSEAQKDIIRQVLESRNILSLELQGAIKKSEQTLQTHLNDQDMLSKQSMARLSLHVSSSIKESEVKTMTRFDTQDTHLKYSAQIQHAQMAHMLRAEQNAMRRRLLEALEYPEINERRNMIEGRIGNFGQTYKWIFDDSRHGRTAFSQWLQSDETMFWINGKPGSGKSSLMTYIYHNIRPGGPGASFLKKWAHPYDVKLLTFWFFRPVSSHLLKSLEGFWRSLCFQLLDMDNSLVERIRADDLAPPALKSALVEMGSAFRSWTDSELKEWFFYAMSKSEYFYCILVDGLDEIEKNHQREMLLDIICEISRSSKSVKVCCSCRPESPFKQGLQQYPSIKLQELNHNDILEDCRTQLTGTLAEHFADDIAHRACGVFLWAHLVARQLRAAAQQGDNEDDIRNRLEETPDEMNELFMALLQRQDKYYVKNPKPYLSVLQVFTQIFNTTVAPFNLFDMLVVIHRHETSMTDSTLELDLQSLLALENEAVHMMANMVARCASLVEIHQSYSNIWNNLKPFAEDFSYKALAQACELTVSFIHRSVQDFLLENEKAQYLLQSCRMSEDDALFQLTAASALRYVLNKEQFNFQGITMLATLIQSQPLKVQVARVIHEISATVARRWWMLTEPDDNSTVDGRSIFASSIDLSPIENATLILLSSAGLSLDVLRYIDTREQRKQLYGALVAHIHQVLKPDFVDPVLMSKLQPYLQMNERVTLCYESKDLPGMPFIYTGSIRQHIFVNGVILYHDFISGAQRPQELVDTLQKTLDNFPNVQEEELHMDFLLFPGSSSLLPARILPMPDEITDTLQAKLQRRSIFRFNLLLDVQRPTMEKARMAEVVEWSPPGSDNFLGGFQSDLQSIFWRGWPIR